MKKKISIKKLSLFFVTLFIFAAGASLVFIYSGVYDIAARRPHALIERRLIIFLRNNAVQRHARKLKAPILDNSEKIRRGFVLYKQNCVSCHGAPGVARERIGIGLNPNPPPLVKSIQRWSAEEIGWIISNGLKMAGMPAFSLREQPEDLWALVAFVVRLNSLTPKEYSQFEKAIATDEVNTEISWRYTSDPGWKRLKRANAQRAVSLVKAKGCGSCHIISGIASAKSPAGPSLKDWKKRHYITGKILNNPAGLVRWLKDPRSIEKVPAMPDLDLTEEEAWDIARYLFEEE